MPAISAHGNLRLFPEPRLDRLYEIQKIDAFEWLRARARNSIPLSNHSISFAKLVRAVLPFGEGVVLDPSMGSGSTIAACAALGLKSIGLEIGHEYFAMAQGAIPKLAGLKMPVQNQNAARR